MNLPPLGNLLRVLVAEERGTLPAAAVAAARAVERAAGDPDHANPGLPPDGTEALPERAARGPSARAMPRNALPLPTAAEDASARARDAGRAIARGGADGLLAGLATSAESTDADAGALRATSGGTAAAARAAGTAGASAPGTATSTRPALPPTLASAIALSSAGQIVAEALRNTDPSRASSAPPALRPVVAAPPLGAGTVDLLATGLREAVEHSGIFYEAHLAAWVGGQRDRASLDQEPQRLWPAPAASADAAAAAVESTRRDALPQMVQHQLDVLDARPFVWTGELWPGQSVRLSLVESDAERDAADDAPRAAGADAPPKTMRMRLEFELPKLGPVVATLALDGSDVRVTLTCERPGAAMRLRRAAPGLRSAYAERALGLSAISIENESTS